MTKQIVIVYCALLFLAGCTKNNKQIEVELPGGVRAKLELSETLRINIQTEPPSLDWQLATDTTSSWIGVNFMEGLTQYDINDKELGLKPGLALKWEASEQSTKWKITLRPNVVWSDGVPFTPQHVVDGWKRLLTKETASEYSYFLFGVKNAKEYNEGKKSWEEVGIRITGPLELSIDLGRSMSYFPYLLTHHSTYPTRIDVIKRGGDRWTEPGNIVTIGPYILKQWQHDKMIILERNEKYYGKESGDFPSIKYIVAYMLIEQSTAINLFDSGKLDSVHTLPSVELRKLKSRPEYRAHSNLGIYYYGFNTTKAPTDNPLVRQAIAHSIDRNEIVQLIAGGQVPLSSWVPSGMFGHEPDIGIKFDPAKGRELLKKAGYSDTTKFPKMEIRFNTNEDHARIGENVQAQLKKNLGINVELKNEEWKVYLNSLKTEAPNLFRFGWVGDYPDPDNFLAIMLSYSEQNRSRWKNLKYDELVVKAAGLSDREERKKLYAEAQRILVEQDVPVVPFYTRVGHFLISNRVENYPLNAMEVFSYKGARLKQQ